VGHSSKLAQGVAVSGDYAYVAAWENGLQVLPLQCSTPTSMEQSLDLAGPMRLLAPYPNPAKAGIVIPFAAGRGGQVRLTVHDVAGREVSRLFEGVLRPGSGQWIQSVEWARAKLPAGVYVVRLTTEHGVQARKVVLVN